MSVAGPVRLATIFGGLALATVLAVTARTLRPRAALPVFGHVPSFRLVDEHGQPFSNESMLGHVSVVDFIFTRCTSSCPRLTARMAQLQERISGHDSGVRLVSFSVDPENDTPLVLAAYAEKAGAEAARWTFVTGPVDEVERAVELGFKVSAAKIAKGAADYDVVHGEWLVLVDRTGDIRGYYPTGEAREFRALTDDLSRLENEKK